MFPQRPYILLEGIHLYAENNMQSKCRSRLLCSGGTQGKASAGRGLLSQALKREGPLSKRLSLGKGLVIGTELLT